MNQNDPSRHGTGDNRHHDDERAHGERAYHPHETHRAVPVYGDGDAPTAMRGWAPTATDEYAREGAAHDPFRSGTYPPRHPVWPRLEPPARPSGGYRDGPPGSPSSTPGASYGGRGEAALGDGKHSERFGQTYPNAYGRYDDPGRHERDLHLRGLVAQTGPRDSDGPGHAPSYRGIGPRGYVRSDERLRERVCERLTEADLDASDIDVQAHDGVITFEGSVRDRGSRHRAEDIADDCGAKDIRNYLRVGRRHMVGGSAGLIGHSHAIAPPANAGQAAATPSPASNGGNPGDIDGPGMNGTAGRAGTCGSEAVNRKH